MAEHAIRRAAVLGAGVMGAKIAAHLANAGIPTLLVDIAPAELTEAEARRGLGLTAREVRNRVVAAGWKSALEAKPPALFTASAAALVELGNFTDDLGRLAEADWIVEAVTERLETKRALFAEVDRHRRPGAVVSSNTSGIPIRTIAEGRSEDFRRHFLGTHFFNPPRWLKLLEIIPTADTDPELTRFMARFGEDRLGKGVVLCKDTPNFIANRIGVYAMTVTLAAMLEQGLSIEEVDLATGPVLGRPRSATFRTFDLVGLDTFAHVARNLHASLADDAERERFRLPELLDRMIARGLLGDKSGQGFYRRVRGGGLEALDPRTLDYRPIAEASLPEVERARKKRSLAERTRALVLGPGRAGRFLWTVTSATIAYAAACIPEIADDLPSVDRAMRWGFGHELGPFETWDALGPRRVVDRLRAEGRAVPPLVEELLGSGAGAFYRRRAGRTYHFAPASRSFAREPEAPNVIRLGPLHARGRVVRGNASASLVDLGDGVAYLEFHSKMNTLDAGVLELFDAALEETARGFEGLVIANEGENFSAGANLVEVLELARGGEWGRIDAAVRRFQEIAMRLRYAPKPVVAAPHQRALGGGCEIVLHADQVHASAELYIGFVEVAVGLIPAAGGCKEMVRRAADEAGSDSDMELFPRIRRIFELIATARVSSSAADARELGLLGPRDHVSINADQRVFNAKADVLALAREGYVPGAPRADIPVLGTPGLASLKLGLHLMERGGYISEYDRAIGTRLATVLTGGAYPGVRRVSEAALLDLEREAFLGLLGESRTQERIEHMLRTGKPLRN